MDGMTVLWRCHYDVGGSSGSVKTWYRVDGFRLSGGTILRQGLGLDHLLPHLAPRLKKEQSYTSTLWPSWLVLGRIFRLSIPYLVFFFTGAKRLEREADHATSRSAADESLWNCNFSVQMSFN